MPTNFDADTYARHACALLRRDGHESCARSLED